MSVFWTDVYQRHFQKYFEKPFDIQVYHDPDGLALKVATHDLAMEGYRVYASMGLADKLAETDEDNFGEVIVFSDVPDPEVPRLFVNALFFILQNDIPLDSRFSVGFADIRSPFVARYKKTSLYFTRAHGPDEQFNKVRLGETFGRVYQAYFITREEDEFLEAYGADVFEQDFMAQPDHLRLRRESWLK